MKNQSKLIVIIALVAVIAFWDKIKELFMGNPYKNMITAINDTFKKAQDLLNKGLAQSTDKGVTSDNGVDIIKTFEGYRSRAYKDAVGVYTIGYGHTKGVKAGDVITKEKAEIYLREDLKDAENAVNKYVTVPLTQNQFDALVSFTFNLGAGNLKRSTLLKLLNQKQYSEASGQFSRWVYAGGKKLNGLVTRRETEARLFNA